MKTIQWVFIVCVGCMLYIPYIFAQRNERGTSAQENRNLAPIPHFRRDGAININYPSEYEKWFADHLGFRNTLISYNGQMEYYYFNKLPDTSAIKLGKTGDLNYAPLHVIQNFTHTNLRTPKEIEHIGGIFQKISDYFENQGVQYYYVQCVDKQTIFPEQFLAGVKQLGPISKTDQIMEYLKNNTTVKHIYLKDLMSESKRDWYVYSRWGDSTHWTDRGAYIGYKAIMRLINTYNNNIFKSLEEDDYEIDAKDLGYTFYGTIHKEDSIETFTIKKPMARRVQKTTDMPWFPRKHPNSVWKNPSDSSNTKVLILSDSYIYGYLIDDFAESFSETVLISSHSHGRLDYPEILRKYQPDIVIHEVVERMEDIELIEAMLAQMK